MSEPKLDPYVELGVPPTADLGEIKAAYKAKAKELHPDSADNDGDAAAFQRAHTSYKLLTDQTARSHYDKTGTWPDSPSPLNPLQEKALTIIATFMMESIQGGSDPNCYNVLNAVKLRVVVMREENKRKVTMLRSQADRADRLLKKTKIKEGEFDNLLTPLMIAQSIGLKKVADGFQEVVDFCDTAISILDKYKMTPEPPPTTVSFVSTNFYSGMR